ERRRKIGDDTSRRGGLQDRGGRNRLPLCHLPGLRQIGRQRGKITVGHRFVSQPHPLGVLVHLQAALFQRGGQPVDKLLPVSVRGPHVLPIVHGASASCAPASCGSSCLPAQASAPGPPGR